MTRSDAGYKRCRWWLSPDEDRRCSSGAVAALAAAQSTRSVSIGSHSRRAARGDDGGRGADRGEGEHDAGDRQAPQQPGDEHRGAGSHGSTDGGEGDAPEREAGSIGAPSRPLKPTSVRGASRLRSDVESATLLTPVAPGHQQPGASFPETRRRPTHEREPPLTHPRAARSSWGDSSAMPKRAGA